jgi:sugar lactone lactonase YvrE
METNITTSNGLAWNSAATIMYYIDTATRQVAAYDYDIDTGAISGKRVVIEVPDDMGPPDGMTIDQDGMLWIAIWGGWRITRWNPDNGALLASYEVPTAKTTSCCFGGSTLRDLYITTARIDTPEEDLESQPTAGGLFKLTTDVQGTETFAFEG